MADNQAQMPKANCTKCGIKHSRPVGNRCRRQLNVSAPVGGSNPAVDIQHGVPPPGDASSTTHTPVDVGSSASSASANTSQVSSKLDLILRKMETIENKNIELENKITTMTSGRTSVKLAHSSPKKSHKCLRRCESRSSLRAPARGEYTGSLADSSSDEDFDPMSSGRQLHRHSSRLSDSHTSQQQLSLDFLKNDDHVQKKVQRQLEMLQGQHRTTSGKSIKSGLHRAGDNSVKCEIAWPHHHCFPGAGGQLPDCKELSPLQFMVGFLGCLQEETSSTARANMVSYGRHLFQDAVETNWTTARHAHMILLQDIERGKCTWRDADTIEKIRIRNTARVIQPKAANSNQKQHKNGQKEIICADYSGNTCKHSTDHVVEGKIHRHACSYCMQEVGKLCFHRVQDCLRRKGNNKDQKGHHS